MNPVRTGASRSTGSIILPSVPPLDAADKSRRRSHEVKSKQWYTGFTHDLRKRFSQHSQSETGGQNIVDLLDSFTTRLACVSKTRQREKLT